MIPTSLRPALFVLALLALGPVQFVYALTLPEALNRVEARSSVVSARTERRDAQANLERALRDPLAVRADTLQAEQRLSLAEASLERARYAALSELTNAYTGVLQVNEQAALAERGLALSERSLEIATIRLENGSATQLDLGDAQASLDEAQNTLRAAREARDLALNNLASILGEEVEAADLEGIPGTFFAELPPLEAALESAERHPDLLSVEQQAELAALSADVLDPLYAPQTQIDTAESQLASARSAFEETRRGFLLQVRNLYSQAENARETLRLEAASLANARARLQTQRQRLEGGLISQIEFEQAVVATAQARLEAEGARVGYLSALLELQAGSLVPLGGPFAASLGGER
ncbi:MAG: hypothetical protein AVDCRST_MAG86-3430 [uncultured Truepera sp.]|uniref:Uncharacterized protein n=1 Tax=uncultured Truepera sp. TaxID=543023 RepID=A0A6J4VUL6_9DEIN|nr:MAG: hypothetical protein AVDCRST_MAG86-3430 [uncultured Truepera sp.]